MSQICDTAWQCLSCGSRATAFATQMATEGNFFIFAMWWHLYGSHVAVSFMAIIFSFFRQKNLKKDLNGSWEAATWVTFESRHVDVILVPCHCH
jgi:hypothetical protein